MCYKIVQSFRVHCVFTGQYYTEDYITFKDVIQAIGGSTCSGTQQINLVGSLVTLIAYQPYTLVGSLKENPLAVKLLDNRLYMTSQKWRSTSQLLCGTLHQSEDFIVYFKKRHQFLLKPIQSIRIDVTCFICFYEILQLH